jgi:hypothetical protein
MILWLPDRTNTIYKEQRAGLSIYKRSRSQLSTEAGTGVQIQST